MTVTEEQIRSIIDDRIGALRARDAKRFLSQMEAGFSSFELVPPLQYLDNDPTSTTDPLSYCHSLYHIKGNKKEGEKVDLWARQTLCFREGTQGLKISHTHMSVPFNMDREHKAAIDLKP